MKPIYAQACPNAEKRVTEAISPVYKTQWTGGTSIMHSSGWGKRS
ncbi:hypothetical protein [Chroococcidiopsis sp. CCALA 051]|nr:hypothetical protein [Chroococcidiopsis sp. CCALA 051]